MGRKIYRLLALCVLTMCCFSAWSAAMIVEDPSALIKFTEILRQGKDNIQELQGATHRLTSLNEILGNNNPRLAGLINSANQWGGYLDGFGSLETDPLSLLNQLGYKRAGHTNYASLTEMGRYVSEKLFVPRTDQNEATNISSQRLESIKQERILALEKSSISGMVVSGKSKHELRQVQRKVAELGMEGVRAPTVLEALIINNKLLSVIASELVQQREIQTQQLELLSAFVTQGSSLVTRTLPSPRTP